MANVVLSIFHLVFLMLRNPLRQLLLSTSTGKETKIQRASNSYVLQYDATSNINKSLTFSFAIPFCPLKDIKHYHLYEACSHVFVFPPAFSWDNIKDNNVSICIFISNDTTGILKSTSLLLWQLALAMLHFYCTDVKYEETDEVIE